MDVPVEHVDMDSPEGPRLSCAVVTGADGATGRVMVFMHGIASHGAFYCDALAGLRDVVDALYLPDLRGHGRSGGGRGEVEGGRELMADIGRTVSFARARHPGARLVLAGESMGGLLALAYASRRAGDVDALVLAAPALKLHFAKLLAPRRVLHFAPRMLAAGLEAVPNDGDLPSAMNRSAELERLIAEDGRQLKSVSLRYLTVVARFMVAWKRYARRAAGTPALILHGQQDDLIDPGASRTLHRFLPGSELLQVPQGWHNLFFDPSTPEVVEAIRRWLKANVAPTTLSSAGPHCGGAAGG